MDHVDSLIAAAVAGAGIVQHMSVSLQQELQAGHLLPILTEWEAPGPDVSILFQQQQHRAAKVRAFVDFAASLFPQ
jgi:LysR family transcriptional regulator for bpeEF and oprC